MRVKETRNIETNELTGYVVDGRSIPMDDTNPWYQTVQQWIADGNLPEPAFSEAELTQHQQQKISSAIQAMLDSKAQEYRYDDIKSAALRAAFPGSPFHAEGVAFATWMDSCWKIAGRIEEDVKAGTRTMPTVDEVLAEMPEFTQKG